MTLPDFGPQSPSTRRVNTGGEPKYTLAEARVMLHHQICWPINSAAVPLNMFFLGDEYLKCRSCGGVWRLEPVKQLPVDESLYPMRQIYT